MLIARNQMGFASERVLLPTRLAIVVRTVREGSDINYHKSGNKRQNFPVYGNHSDIPTNIRIKLNAFCYKIREISLSPIVPDNSCFLLDYKTFLQNILMYSKINIYFRVSVECIICLGVYIHKKNSFHDVLIY